MRKRLIDRERKQRRQAERLATGRALLGAANTLGRGAIARTAAIGTGDVDVGQELHVERNLPRPVAGGATQASRVVREVARLQTRRLRRLGASIGAAQVVEHAAVRCHGRADVHPNGGRVDQVRAPDTVCGKRRHMLGKLLASRCLRERGNERLQHERRLPRTRHARHGNEAASRDIDRERLHGMQPARFQVDSPQVEHFPSLRLRASRHAHRPRKKGAYD